MRDNVEGLVSALICTLEESCVRGGLELNSKDEALRLYFSRFGNRVGAMDVIKEAVECIKTTHSVLSTKCDVTAFTLENYVFTVVETLVHHLGSVSSDTWTSAEQRRSAALVFVLQLLVAPQTLEGFNVDLALSKPVNQVMYNSSRVYQSLVRCGFLLLESTWASPYQNQNSEFSEIDLTVLFLLHLFEQVHNAAALPEPFRVPRRLCCWFLVFCGYCPSTIVRNAAKQLLLSVAFTTSTDKEKRTYFGMVSQIFTSLLNSKLQFPPECFFSEAKTSKVNRSIEELNSRWLQYFIPFFLDCVPHFPPETQVSLLGGFLLDNSVLEERFFGKTFSSDAAASIGQAIATFFSFYQRPSFILHDSAWDAQLRMLRSLLTYRLPRFHALASASQLTALFSGLRSLIRNVDDIPDDEAGKEEIQLTRRTNIASLVVEMVESKSSCYRTAMVETDPAIQTAISEGWALVVDEGVDSLQTPSKGGVLLYPLIIKSFQFFLVPKFKPLWRNLFSTIASLTRSVSKLGLAVYPMRNAEILPIALRALCMSWESVRDDHGLNTFSCRLEALFKDSSSFGPWYLSYRSVMYQYLFRGLAATLAEILHEAEEPSKALLSSRHDLDQDTISLQHLKSEDAAIYRLELRQCVGALFETFGVSTLLQLESLSLSRLTEVPMTSPSFAYDTNSWVLLLMARTVRRDRLGTFVDLFFPLIQTLTEKAQRVASGHIATMEARNYQRLVEQIWALLPRFANEALDVVEVFSTPVGRFVNMLLTQLNTPVVKEHICLALSTLFDQTSAVINCGEKEFCCTEEKRLPADTTDFLRLLWDSVASTSTNVQVFQQQANKILGFYVVRYLQMHQTATVLTNSVEQQELSRTTRLFRDTIRALSLLCDSEILEQNLKNFSATWTSMVAEAANCLTGNVPSQPKSAITLSPSQCGALVDVVGALIPRLPLNRVRCLTDVFVKLLADCATGISNAKSVSKRPSSKVLQPVVTQHSARSHYDTLHCLLRRAYKGLQHCIYRLINAPSSEHSLAAISVEEFANWWQVIVDIRPATRKTNSGRCRIGALNAMMRLLGHMKTSNLQREEFFDDQIIQHTMKELIPELLLGFSNVNRSVRDQATELLQSVLQGTLSADQAVVYLLPGLASSTPCMRSASAAAFRVLLRSYGDQVKPETIQHLRGIILLLLRNNSKPVFRQTIKLIRVLQRFVPNEQLPELFKEYIEPVLTSSHAISCRLVVRHLIEKVLGRLGMQTLEPLFPATHLSLLHYVHRALRRRQEKRQRKPSNTFAEEAVLTATSRLELGDKSSGVSACNASDSDSGDTDAENRPLTRRTEPSPRSAVTPGTHSLKNLLDAFEADDQNVVSFNKRKLPATKSTHDANVPYATCLVDSLEVDLLSKETKTTGTLIMPQAVADSLTKKKRRTTTQQPNHDDAQQFKVAVDGRFIVEDDAASATGVFGDATQKEHHNIVTAPTARCMDNQPNNRFSLKHVQAKRELKKTERVKKGHHVQKPAAAFKSIKGTGDVSHNNGVAPYSYIRLNPKLAKEKFRSSVIKLFNAEIRSARKQSSEKKKK